LIALTISSNSFQQAFLFQSLEVSNHSLAILFGDLAKTGIDMYACIAGQILPVVADACDVSLTESANTSNRDFAELKPIVCCLAQNMARLLMIIFSGTLGSSA